MRRFAAVAFLVVALTSASAHASVLGQPPAPLVVSLGESGLKVVVNAPEILGSARTIEVVAASPEELLRVSVSQQSSGPVNAPPAPSQPKGRTVSPPAPPAMPAPPPPSFLPIDDLVSPSSPRARAFDDVVVPRVLDAFDDAETPSIFDTSRQMPVAYAAILVAMLAGGLVLWFVSGKPLEASLKRWAS